MAEKNIPTVSMFRFVKNAGRILKNPLPFHRENFEKYGDVFQIHIGLGQKIIFSRDAAFAEYVLQKNQKNYQKSTIQTKDLAKYVGKGLLTASGEHWAKQRKLIQPAFHKSHLSGLLQSVQEAIKIEIDKIQPNDEFDVFPVFNDLAFQTVVKSLFSSAANQEQINRLQYITEAAQKMLVKELRQPFKRWWFHLSGKIKKHINLTREARQILEDIVEERKKSGVRYDDLLDMLLDARYENGEPMEKDQLIDEILILFTAGHETTSNALTFTCELLARNPEAQEKIFSEVEETKNKTQDLMEFVRSCSFTQNVIEESMRLYPPAYFIDRVNIEEDNFNGFKLPENSSILFSCFEIHRHKKHWDNPETFDPERFLNAKTHSSYYFPFGAGPRKCIGNNFAMFEMIMAIAEVISRYKIAPKTSEIQIKPLITLKPKNAILRFENRS
ncbi:cytochrome P450 [Salegentibacter sp. JZCK2]|uniref:cytochrome P450 n=1 Tax=Salegentibacter tibetensis TaxID=2873600 RepID=UPI001CCBD284|nr:cytochrome P450 [Salegentibacter tibetensis]MBZ9729565.1 cytochrome P450 [Salegentibacter tibetensis]